MAFLEMRVGEGRFREVGNVDEADHVRLGDRTPNSPEAHTDLIVGPRHPQANDAHFVLPSRPWATHSTRRDVVAYDNDSGSNRAAWITASTIEFTLFKDRNRDSRT